MFCKGGLPLFLLSTVKMQSINTASSGALCASFVYGGASPLIPFRSLGRAIGTTKLQVSREMEERV